MNKRAAIIAAFIIICTAITLLLLDVVGKPGTGAPYDEFAMCLRQKNVTMYGADWCANCRNEKEAFGSSFRFVPYVECPDEPKLCLEKGINGYPTWIFPDGRRLEGEQGLERLSAESGCELPQDQP